MEELKTIAHFYDPASASIVKGMLEANGIKAEVFGEVSSYPVFNAFTNSIKVKVNPEDYDQALSLLAASESIE